ncbi:MAG: hypothetical protein ACE141_16870 [Bryobacteraceae bacterium]
MKSKWNAALILVVLLGTAGLPLFAQNVISAQAGLVNFTEGPVLINEKATEPSRGTFPQMKEQDTLRTTWVRAELLLNPGVFLRVGRDSSFRLLSSKITDSKVELLSGSVVLEAGQMGKKTAVTLLLGDATISILKPGLYRLDAEPAGIKVFEGKAAVQSGGKRVVEVKKGRFLSLAEDTVALKFDRKHGDALDQWSGKRAGYLAMVNLSTARSLWGQGRNLRCNGWCLNSYYGMVTFIPLTGYYYSPYGYYFYSPREIYQPRSNDASYGGYQGGGGGGIGSPASSTGYAGSSSRVDPPSSGGIAPGVSSGRVDPPSSGSVAPSGGRVSPP